MGIVGKDYHVKSGIMFEKQSIQYSSLQILNFRPVTRLTVTSHNQWGDGH